MKNLKWYFGFVSTFILLISSTFSAFALTQSQRHPTEVEIQNIIREFHRFANLAPDVGECCSGSESDSRSSSDKQALATFTRAWSSVNPNIAPFLGHWINNDADIGVYPSFIRDRVCIIYPYIGGGYAFGVGSFQNGYIQINSGELSRRALVRQQNRSGNVFLLDISVHNGSARAYPGSDIYTYPRHIRSLDDAGHSPQEKTQLLQQFSLAGCTTSAPNR